MKKITTLAATLLLAVTAASAQNNLSGLFGKVAGVLSGSDTTATSILNTIGGLISKSTSSVDKIPGNWTFTGSAIAFKSENALSNVASTVAEGTIEKKMDEYLAKVGVVAGKFGFNFKEDGTVVMNYGGKNFNGTWTYDEETAKINMKFAKLVKANGYLTMQNGTMKLLFDASTMLKILKSVSAKSNNTTLASLNTLLKSYNKMYAGFKLTK